MTALAPALGNQLAYPGAPPEKDVIRLQEKAEAAFEAGDYRRALWFYRKELAPIADKFAQYMIGHMYENGLGVPRDLIQAAAWYQVAAERGHQQFVDKSQALLARLTPAELGAAQEAAESLKGEIGDIALLKLDIRRDMNRLRVFTGSNLRISDGRCGVSNAMVVFARDLTTQMTASQYCEIINARIEKRLAYIQGYITYGELELLPDEDEAEAAGEAEAGE